jgi:ABC-type transport system involved in multi-copper enzyme maturation permease subunit
VKRIVAEVASSWRGLALRVAGFEFRLQVRSPVFLIVVAISALMVVGSLTVEQLQVGPLRAGNRTSAEAVLAVHLVWSLFFLFTAAAFAADAALRDETARSGEIVRSTPAPRAGLALGRLGGSLAAVLLAFASVPAALMIAPFVPWAGPIAQPDLRAVAYGALVMATPNLILATAAFFALATMARSAMAAYLGSIALLVLYGLGSTNTGPSTFALALLDPFGFAAIRVGTSGWSAVEHATTLPPISGPLALNRLLWFGVAIGAILLAAYFEPPATKTGRPTLEVASAPAPIAPRVLAAHRFRPGTEARQFVSRTRLELRRMLQSPFLLLLLLLGIASVVGALAQLPPGATQAEAVVRVDDAFRLVPIVVATFWAGELTWGERDVGLGELVASSPVPTAALVLSKALTLLLILAVSLGTVALTACGLEASRTGALEIRAWVLGFALPRIWDAGLMAILAVFLQAIAPGKLAGFGLMVLYLISALALETTGFHGDLYRYGGASASLALDRVVTPYAILVRAYWGAAALLLVFLTLKLANRGVPEQLGTKLARAAGQFGPRYAILFLAAAAAMGLLGSVLLVSSDAAV